MIFEKRFIFGLVRICVEFLFLKIVRVAPEQVKFSLNFELKSWGEMDNMEDVQKLTGAVGSLNSWQVSNFQGQTEEFRSFAFF